MNKHFDYIIAGAGCSGLTMAWQLKEVLCEHETVLVIDRKCADENDRTWAFWSDECHWINEFQHHKWGEISVKNGAKSIDINVENYSYYMVRSADYYNKIVTTLKQDSRFSFVTDEITNISADQKQAYLTTNSNTFTGKLLFNSCFPGIRHFASSGYSNLVQQFCGFYVESTDKPFHKNRVTLMDFNTPQKDVVTFAYVLPVSEKCALIECVTIGKSFMPVIHIKEMLKKYIREQLAIENYTLNNEECGWIPMTDGQFNPYLGPKVINLGIIGGAIKPSTGYSFFNTQKQVEAIVNAIKLGKSPQIKKSFLSKRFALYDATFLYLLREHPHKGSEILTNLFEKNNRVQILKFLNNQTTIYREIRIFCSVNFRLFIPAIIKVLFQRIRTKKTAQRAVLNEVYS